MEPTAFGTNSSNMTESTSTISTRRFSPSQDQELTRIKKELTVLQLPRVMSTSSNNSGESSILTKLLRKSPRELTRTEDSM
jgi:AMMECR1 domain-containing protein